MYKIKLYYIDKKYAIAFEVKHKLFPMSHGAIDSQALNEIIIDCIGSFGKSIDIPATFMDKMIEEDFDALLIKITYKLDSLIFRFYLSIPESKKILYASHIDGEIYRLFAINEVFSAIKPINNVNNKKDDIVWARHEAFASEYTRIA